MEGNPLGPDNGLLLHLPTGKVYFREGNVIRYIVSWEIFEKYHFNPDVLNWPQSRVTSINQYQIGAPITL